MNNLPLVTIIVPCYNVEKYIQQCIDSILNQIYGNIQLILIDDGSTDNTNEVIQKSIANSKNTIYIKNKNSGVSNARNIGIKNATGEYIMFVDSDDYISKNMIKNMYRLITKYNSDLVKCNISKEYIEGNLVKFETPIYSRVKYLDNKNFSKTIYKKILSTETMNSACFSLFKTNIIKENNLLFREDVYNGEDAMFFMNYIDLCKNIVYTPASYYHYVIRNNGLTGTGISMEKLWDSKLKFIQELKNKEEKWNLKNYNYVDKKIIHIVMSCIYRLYKKNEKQDVRYNKKFLSMMIKDVDFINLLNKTNYKNIKLTEDRIIILDNIMNNNLKGAIELIKLI
ncbi:MAG: glycosyltransferase family 2 protein [Clostridia bacterium]|nr:glycosyltransferase family 2 protein [Clostridia bacterium]MDD4386528.1 glycosyltransferase family 2 protein [Clostridia bacterium]